MKSDAEKRHEISDKAWKKIEPHLPGQRVNGDGQPKIIVALSMQCFGYLERERLGATCQSDMGAGAIHTVDLSGGEQREPIKNDIVLKTLYCL